MMGGERKENLPASSSCDGKDRGKQEYPFFEKRIRKGILSLRFLSGSRCYLLSSSLQAGGSTPRKFLTKKSYILCVP